MNFRFVLTRSIELSTTFIPTTIDTRNLNLNLNNQNYFSSFIARSGVFINEVGTSFRQSAQNIGELIQDNAGKVGNFTTNFFQGLIYESALINTELPRIFTDPLNPKGVEARKQFEQSKENNFGFELGQTTANILGIAQGTSEIFDGGLKIIGGAGLTLPSFGTSNVLTLAGGFEAAHGVSVANTSAQRLLEQLLGDKRDLLYLQSTTGDSGSSGSGGSSRMAGGLANPEATFGVATTNNYKGTFFNVNPSLKGKVVVHHAVEQQVLKKYPGVVKNSEIHSIENLRGIPKSLNSDLHLS